MADTTGKSIGLAQQSNRQSRVIIEKTILFGRCNECSFRCGEVQDDSADESGTSKPLSRVIWVRQQRDFSHHNAKHH